MTDAASLMQAPEYEVLPFRSIVDQAEHLPPGATVTVTSSPAQGMGETVKYATGLARRGFSVVPHLAARSIADDAELTSILDALGEAGIGRVFVVAGDDERAGEFPDGLSLIRAIQAIGYRLPMIGIPGYPDGHPFIPGPTLLQALLDKQPYAGYVTTQMCFDPAVIARWIASVRQQGITLPIHIGMPAPAPLARLATIGARIGVGDSIRFLTRHKGLLGRLVKGRSYRPDELLDGLEEVLADPLSKVEALHVYTFNEIEAFEAWRTEYLAEIGG
jgi:methylenetetrahydrofolate reductase (NADPH)